MSTDIVSTSNLSTLSTKTSISTNEFKSQSNIDIEMKNSSLKNDQSLSYWQSINTLVTSDPNLIPEIIQRYVSQLQKDEIIHIANGDVMSYAAIAAPRLGCHLDKTTRIAHDLAYALYPPKNINDETLLNWSKIRYSKLISSLSKITKEKIEQQQQSLLIQQHGHKQQYKTCSIPRQLPPISAEIANPTAMPVVQSASDDFIDIFHYLQTQHHTNHIENINTSDVEASKLVEFKRGVVYTDGRVDLCKQVVGPACIEDLMDALRENTFIKHFLLGNNIIGTTGAKAIAHFITTILNPNPHRMMHTFYLAGNDINHMGIQYLTDALIKNTCVNALWLKRNPIGIEGSKHIANLLLYNQYISILDLDNCALFDDGIITIMNALIHAKHDTLRHLYLNSNGIGIRGAQAIASYFEHVRATGRKGLNSLWMSVNRIGDEGAILIGNAIRNNTTLKRLTLGSNNITAVGAKVLLHNLITCSFLQHLSLSMYVSTSDMGELPNHLGDDGATYVADFISQHNAIQSISLAHNGITDIGRDALEKAIMMKKNMLDIELAENKGLLQHQLSLETTSFLLSNIRQFYNNPTMTLQEYHQQYQRLIKQPKRVQYIDSVYRTRAFINRAERVKMIKRWDEIKWDTEQRQAGLTRLQSHRMGFGTYRLLENDAYNSVLNAIQYGYHLIDTAILYKNQIHVGNAMVDTVKRGYINDVDKDLFVTTKVLDGDQQKGADAIIHSLTKSLIELKLQKLHLVLLHNYIPGYSHEAWRTLVSLQNRGLIQHIGVSNFSIAQLESLKSVYFDPKQQQVSHLDGYILPLVNQIEISPYCYRSKIDLIRYCQQENIMIQCHTPLIKGKKLDDPILCEIAKEMNITPAQVLLIWSIHHMKLQVLVRSSNTEHIKENWDVINMNQTLTQKQLNALENIDDGFVTHKVKEKL